MARFYSNENFPLPVVVALRDLGHDVLTSVDAGRANQRISDDDVIRFASIDARAVLTFNHRHFVHAHRRSSDHAGIVSCTVDADYASLARRIHNVVAGRQSLQGQFIRVVRE